MKKSEFALLKSAAVLERMQQASGLDLSQMERQAQELAIATAARMKDLGIPFPSPIGNARLLSATPTGAAYRVVRTLAGKGIGKGDRILFNVFSSVRIEDDNQCWQHVSFTRLDSKMPTYADLVFIKETFFPDRWAIQVFPKMEEHVSDHDRCLHLWSCLEHNVLPDFRKFGTI
ncbi:MAG: hypothetical protein SNJ57_13145 [Cyanobacteriota bacterium]